MVIIRVIKTANQIYWMEVRKTQKFYGLSKWDAMQKVWRDINYANRKRG